MIRYANLFVILFVLSFCLPGFAYDEWEQAVGIKESSFKDVAWDPYNNVIYTSSEKTLYRSGDFGNNWAPVFSAHGEESAISFIGISKEGIFICASNGLLASADGISGWRNIFSGVGSKESSVTHIAFSKDGKILLGTKAGLFISSDNSLTWQKDSGEIGNLSIRWIEAMDDLVFAATEKGVYKSADIGWKRTFVTSRENIEYDADATDEEIQAIKPVNSISINKNNVFLATDSGIFSSEDKGETWKEFIDTGLLSLRVRRILTRDSLYAVTDKGIFVYSEQNNLWQVSSKGLGTRNIKSITVDGMENLWLATNKGLYKSKTSSMPALGINPSENLDIKSALELFNHEPGIRDVQEMAIRYAEVHPDKIKEWRSAAGKKALFPNVSVGLDRYITDYWHWDSGTNPDTLQKGKDAVSWDISMSWDLGDLIWSSDQTSIDTRSKLMVELRDDIMNEVTRTYFERRRLQIDLFASPPKDLKLSLEKELRLQELTADIDALTGNYFSAHLKK